MSWNPFYTGPQGPMGPPPPGVPMPQMGPTAPTRPQMGPPPPMGAQGATGAQGAANPSAALAKAMQQAQAKALVASAQKERYETTLKSINAYEPPKQKNAMTAIAAGLRGYATRKAANRMEEAATKEATALAESNAYEQAYGVATEAEKLKEQRDYAELIKAQDRAADNAEKIAEEQRKLAAKKEEEKRAQSYELTDTTAEQAFWAKVDKRVKGGMSRDDAIIATQEEVDEGKERRSAVAGTGQFGKVGQNQIDKDLILYESNRQKLEKIQDNFKPEYLGAEADVKGFIGGWDDYFRAENSGDWSDFNAERKAYFSSVYNYINEELLRRSGAAVTKPEMDRFVMEFAVPKAGTGPKAFVDSIQAVIDNTDRIIALRKSQGGYTYNQQGELVESPGAPPIDPDAGKDYLLRKAQEANAQQAMAAEQARKKMEVDAKLEEMLRNGASFEEIQRYEAENGL